VVHCHPLACQRFRAAEGWHHARVARPRSRRRSAALLAALLALAALCLSGCVRVHAAMAVSGDDHVSGDIVAATPPAQDSDPGPQLTVPPELAAKATVKPYKADGYTGTELTFDNITFDQLRNLTTSSSAANSRYQFTLRRSGELVTLSGSVDLTQVPPDHADVQVKISFPGQVVSTNGREEQPGTIAWSPKPGQASMLLATVSFAGDGTATWLPWAMLVGGLTGGSALIVLVLALVSHRRHVRSLTPVR
jgi:type 1 fimbria pilin